MIKKIIELNTKEIHLWVGSDKIIRSTIVAKRLDAIATIKYLIKVILSKHSAALPLIWDTRQAEDITDMAVSILLIPKLNKMTLATAVLIKRPTPEKIIGMINMTLLQSKVKYPIKTFTDENEALEWAKQYSPKEFDFSKL